MNNNFKTNFKIASYVVLAITFIAALSLAIMYFVVVSEKNGDSGELVFLERWKEDFLKYYTATNALIVSFNIPFWMVKIWLLIDGVTMKIHRDKQNKKSNWILRNTMKKKIIKNRLIEKEKQENENILRNEKNKIVYIKNFFSNYGTVLTDNEATWIYKHLKHENAYEIKDYLFKNCYLKVDFDVITKLINEK